MARDFQQARDWWEQAPAAIAHFKAEYELGLLQYYQGDRNRARQLWEKAAAAGSYLARRALADYFGAAAPAEEQPED